MVLATSISALALLLLGASSASPAQETDEVNVRKLGLANNHLGLKLFNSLATQSSGKNVFFSPLSISTVFGMLYYGTRGETSMELREILGYATADLNDEYVHRTFSYLLESLEGNNGEYVLGAANSILVDKHLGLMKEYKKQVQNLYQAAVLDVDFAKNAPLIVYQLNEWVKDKTHGKIEKLVDELSTSTAMVLLNAVYFKGTWKKEFNKNLTVDRSFYNNGLKSQVQQVPFMYMEEKLPYARMDGYQVVELPYKGEDISMLIFVPDHIDGVEDLENQMFLKNFMEVRSNLKGEKVHLTLPKFKLEYEKELVMHMKEIGADKLFSSDADFSGISTNGRLSIDSILHKAVVEVNEEGSEAAAVTGLIITVVSLITDETPKIVADHPFIFTIVDKRSDAILFMGKVNKL